MAIIPITKQGTPVLHKPSTPVPEEEFGTDTLRAFIADMLDTMRDANGVGIAAPQVGKGVRIFIADSPKGPIALINPVFTKKSWKMRNGEEGCLSIPGKFDKLKRSQSVEIEARTVEGEKIAFAAEGFFARVLQHEMDHLDGLLYVDRIEEQRGE